MTLDEHGRPQPPSAGGEIETLLGFLELQRATFAWKCGDLDSAGLSAAIATSPMTLGGLLKHMALVEESWFAEDFLGRQIGPPWDTVDWKADRDWEWHTAGADSPAELYAIWQRAVDGARVIVNEALAAGGLDTLAVRPDSDGTAPSLRWILFHMIEEYARHIGHADLIRESVDGLTGE